MSISEALENALASTDVPAQSSAAVALARRYAALMDDAAPAGKYRVPLSHLAKVFEHYAATVRMPPMEARGVEASEVAILNALAEHSVASDLGPKLLAALTALNLTLPAANAGAKPEVEREQSVQPLDAERTEAQRLKIVR